MGVPEGPTPALTVAEQFSQWMSWTDAIALSAALNGDKPAAPAAGGGQPNRAGQGAERNRAPLAALKAEVAAQREGLAREIGSLTVPATANRSTGPSGRLARPVSRPRLSDEDLQDPATYRRHIQAQQRLMEARLGPLRSRVRAALAEASPALRQLAALDAVLEQALAAREKHALGALPGLLDQRLQALREADAATEQPSATPAPARWPAQMLGEVQAVLLAELEMRMQGIDGMMNALEHQAAGQP